MKAKEIMTQNPACCVPATNLQEVARMMCDSNCGVIPVVESLQSMKLSGILTDRDIVCRSVAEGKNPLQLAARDCMSKQIVSVPQDASLEDCLDVLERNQIRRVPVVDKKGACIGILSLADLAKSASPEEAGKVLQSISEPTEEQSAVGAG